MDDPHQQALPPEITGGHLDHFMRVLEVLLPISHADEDIAEIDQVKTEVHQGIRDSDPSDFFGKM